MSTTMDEKLAEFSAAVLADAQKQRAELEAENANLKSTNETLEAENAALLFQTLTGEEYIA